MNVALLVLFSVSSIFSSGLPFVLLGAVSVAAASVPTSQRGLSLRGGQVINFRSNPSAGLVCVACNWGLCADMGDDTGCCCCCCCCCCCVCARARLCVCVCVRVFGCVCVFTVGLGARVCAAARRLPRPLPRPLLRVGQVPRCRRDALPSAPAHAPLVVARVQWARLPRDQPERRASLRERAAVRTYPSVISR